MGGFVHNKKAPEGKPRANSPAAFQSHDLQPSQKHPQEKGARKSMNVLVVDDLDFMREILSQFLVIFKHTPAAVPSAEAALQACEKTKFDLILCDLNLNGRSGTELLASLRQKGMDIPIIFMTGDLAQSHEDGLKAMGAKGVLQKPIGLVALREAIEKLFPPESES
jgi:CheY-like chemotaxis protein